MVGNELITVIVPVYNCEYFLREAIDSILVQTYSYLELLLINDGSTDSSGLICDEYAKTDKRVRVFHKENEGVSATRNFGLCEAKGRYISFVDSDDICEKDMLEKLYKAIKESNADIAFCKFADYKEECSRLREEPFPAGVYNEQKIREEIILPMIGSRKTSPQCAPVMGSLFRCLFHMELIKSNPEIEFRKTRIAEDLLFLVEYLCRCKYAVVISDVLYYYRTNENSATHRYMKNYWNDRILQFQYLTDVLKENAIYDDKAIEYLGVTQLFFTVSAMLNEMKSPELSYGEKINSIRDFAEYSGFKDNLSWEVIFNMKPKRQGVVFALLKLRMYRAFYFIAKRSLR